MFARNVLMSARSLLGAAGLLLTPRPALDTAADLQPLLLGLPLNDAPGKLMSVVVGSDPSIPVVRYHFARGCDLDACASWVEANVRTWLQQKTGRAYAVEVSWGTVEPVVEARCRPK
jgi:hypothetical protein